MISSNSGTHLGYTAIVDASSIASQGISSPILYRDKEWHDRLPCTTVDRNESVRDLTQKPLEQKGEILAPTKRALNLCLKMGAGS